MSEQLEIKMLDIEENSDFIEGCPVYKLLSDFWKNYCKNTRCSDCVGRAKRLVSENFTRLNIIKPIISIRDLFQYSFNSS